MQTLRGQLDSWWTLADRWTLEPAAQGGGVGDRGHVGQGVRTPARLLCGLQFHKRAIWATSGGKGGPVAPVFLASAGQPSASAPTPSSHPPSPRSSEPRQAPRGIRAPAPARCWAPKGAPPPTPLAGTLALTWGACACAPAPPAAPLPPLPATSTSYPPPRTRGVLWFPRIQSEPPTHLLLILILKKNFFSVLFTICFFPWLKIIGDEPPAAWVPRVVSEGTMRTDNDCIFSPSKTSSNQLPSPGCRSCTKSSGSHIPAFLIICLF